MHQLAKKCSMLVNAHKDAITDIHAQVHGFLLHTVRHNRLAYIHTKILKAIVEFSTHTYASAGSDYSIPLA